MKNSNNKVPKGVVILVIVLILMMIVYFGLVMFFPEFLAKLNLGEEKPFK